MDKTSNYITVKAETQLWFVNVNQSDFNQPDVTSIALLVPHVLFSCEIVYLSLLQKLLCV